MKKEVVKLNAAYVCNETGGMYITDDTYVTSKLKDSDGEQLILYYSYTRGKDSNFFVTTEQLFLERFKRYSGAKIHQG